MSEYTPEDYINHRLSRAFYTLQEAELLINNEFWNTGINRLYYACYYAISAILYKHKVHTSTHSGVKMKFGELFIKNGDIDKKYGEMYSRLIIQKLLADQ